MMGLRGLGLVARRQRKGNGMAYADLAWSTAFRGAPLDLTNYTEVTFEDNFTAANTIAKAFAGPSAPTKWWSATHTEAANAGIWVYPDNPIKSYRVNDLSGGGSLELVMQKRSTDGVWQCGMISTVNHHEATIRAGWKQSMGYFEMKARLPGANGTWPAFWLRSDLADPIKLEIDIVEAYGGPDRDGHHATVHLQGVTKGEYSPLAVDTDMTSPLNPKPKLFPNAADNDLFSDGWKTFGCMIDREIGIRIYYQNKELCRFPYFPELETPVQIIVDLALHNQEDFTNTPSPQTMVVDYVKAMKRVDPIVIEGPGTIGHSLWANSNGPYQWRRDGVAISGATGQSYKVTDADDGKAITCNVSNAIMGTWVRCLPFEGSPALLDIDRANDRYWFNGQRYTRAEFQALPWVPDDLTSLISPTAWTTGTEPFPGYDQAQGAVILTATLIDNDLDRALITFSDGTANERIQYYVRWTQTVPVGRLVVNDNAAQQAALDDTTPGAWVSGQQATISFKYKTNDFLMVGTKGDLRSDKVGTTPTVTKMHIGASQLGTNPPSGSIDRVTYFTGAVPVPDLEALHGLDVVTIAYGLAENDALEARDIFGDGYPALVNALITGKTTIYRQKKRGVFTPIVISTATDLVEVEGVQFADYKGDGNLGIFLSDQDPGRIYLLNPDIPGKYDGTYTRTLLNPVTTHRFVQDMIPFKFPGDDRESIIYTWEGTNNNTGGVGKLRWDGPAWSDTLIARLDGAYNISLSRFANGDFLIGARNASNPAPESGIYRMDVNGVLTTLHASLHDWKQVSIGDFFGNGNEDILANMGGQDLSTKFYMFDAANGYAMTEVDIGKVLRYGCQPAGFKVNGRDAVVVSSDPYVEIWAWNGTAWVLYRSLNRVTTPYKNDDRPARMNIFRQAPGKDFVWADSAGYRIRAIRSVP
jgi:hypothetical protein